jgi:hypothetical protein
MPKRRQTGQTATPRAAASPAIVSTVDEVNLDMVVHDKENKPVLDFKPEDVTSYRPRPGDTTLRSAACHRSIQGTAPGHAGPRSSRPFGSEECSRHRRENSEDDSGKWIRIFRARRWRAPHAVSSIHLRPSRTREAISLATERTEPTNEDAAALPEKNLISVAQTGTDPYGTEVSAEER